MANIRRRRSLTRKMRMRRLYRHQSTGMRLKRSLAKYFNSGWLPGAICLGLLLAAIATIGPAMLWPLPKLIESCAIAIGTVILTALPIFFGFFLGSTIWNLAKRRWWRGGISCTLMFLFLGSLTLSVLQLLIFVKADGV
ncbi:MAG: hypothetical protein AAF635_00330 [Cyanobacteria bacterium P01_C01_bin.69]